MNRLRRVINNTIISLLGQVVTWTSTLLLTSAIGRFLGDAKFGELYFAINFVSLVGILLEAGFSYQIIRDVAQKPDKTLRYLSNILLIKLVIWPIVYSLALLACWLLGYPREILVLVGICGFALLTATIANSFTSFHYALERTIFPAVGTMLEKGLSALAGILLLRAGAGVQAMALVMLGGSLVSAVWQALWFFRLVGTKFMIDLPLMREIIRTNITFLLYAVLANSYTRIDTLLLSLMTNNAVVGWYGAANRIFDAVNFIPNLVMMAVMYPVFAKLSTTSDPDLKLAFEKSVNFLLFCCIPITTIMIVAAPNIIGFLYHRSEFTPAIPALQALAPGVFFVYLNFVFGTTLLSTKQDRKVVIMSAVALVFNLGSNLILIPLYQHVGASIASTLTEFMLLCIGIVFIPRYLLPLGSLRIAGKALIASLAMAGAILLLHTSNIPTILATAMLIYLVVSIALGTIPREDYQAVYIAIRRKAQLHSPPVGQTPQEQETVLSSARGHLDLLAGPTLVLPSSSLFEATASSGTNGIMKTPLSQHTDALLEDDSEITEKRPVVPPQPIPQHTDALLEDDSEITEKRPVVPP